MVIVRAFIGIAFAAICIIGFMALKKQKCPDCGADMEEAFYDPGIDMIVYKCTDCGKEWV
jgi:DNA-directed RNA polymerase subunit RPC12/RpoP